MTTLTFTACLGLTAHADVLETFNYDDGVLSNTATSGTGQQGNWGNFVFSGNVGGNSDLLISNSNLTAPSGYRYTPSNKRLRHDPADNLNGAGIFKLANDEAINFNSASTTYVSFLVRAFQNGSAQGFVGLVDGGGANIVRVGEGGGLGFLEIQSGTTTTDTRQMDSNGANTAGEDNLVVFKIETSELGVDTVSASFWDSATQTVSAEPTTWEITNSFSSTSTGVAVRIDLADGFSDLDSSVDEIRIGDSFAAVTNVPEPASLALIAAGGLLITGRRRSA
jgi:hypothetical protein